MMRVPPHTAEDITHIIEVAVTQFLEELVEVWLQERISERIGDLIINMSGPQNVEESVDESLQGTHLRSYQ